MRSLVSSSVLLTVAYAVSCHYGVRLNKLPIDLDVQYVFGGHLWQGKFWDVNSRFPSWDHIGQCETPPFIVECSTTVFKSDAIYPSPEIVAHNGWNWMNRWWSAGVYPDSDTSGCWVAIEPCAASGIIHPTESPATTHTTTTHTTTTHTTTTHTTTTHTTTHTTTTQTTTHAGTVSHQSVDVPENRQTAMAGPNGECIWPEWLPREYYNGAIVGSGNGVYRWNANWGNPKSEPPNDEWEKIGDCKGPPPIAMVTPEMIRASVDPQGRSYQMILDPWTPLLPTRTEMRDAELQVKKDPKYKATIEDAQMLDLNAVIQVIPQRASNPENVKRVERLFSEAQFEEIFPLRMKSYTYTGFLQSVATFPAYCRSYNDGRDADLICKRILATSFAHFGQEVGGHTPTYIYGQVNHDSDRRHPGADKIYKNGDVIPEWKQGLYWVREIGYTEEGQALKQTYRSCTVDAANRVWGLNFQCPPLRDYFGRGSKQISWSYNYGQFSAALYDDPDYLLEYPELCADTWLNFASGIWFAVTPQSPKPSMLHALDGTWVPNDVDKRSGVKPGFGATIDIINGGLECRGAGGDDRVANRIKYYREMEKYFGLPRESDSTVDCQGTGGFIDGSSGGVDIYWTRDWVGAPRCKATSEQTPWRITVPGDYEKCINWYFRGHWVDKVTKEILSDYGGNPGSTF